MTDDFTFQYAIKLPDGKLASHTVTDDPFIWTDLAACQRAFQNLALNAQQLGVRDWTAEIVHRYSTPFISMASPPGGLADELSEWLKTQSGEQQ